MRGKDGTGVRRETDREGATNPGMRHKAPPNPECESQSDASPKARAILAPPGTPYTNRPHRPNLGKRQDCPQSIDSEEESYLQNNDAHVPVSFAESPRKLPVILPPEASSVAEIVGGPHRPTAPPARKKRRRRADRRQHDHERRGEDEANERREDVAEIGPPASRA